MHWTVRMFDPNGESNIRHMEVSAYVVSQTNRLPAVGGYMFATNYSLPMFFKF